MAQGKSKFSIHDVAEITIGSVVLAFPIAVTEEVWTISESLPLGRTIYISLSSILFIGIFNYYMFYHTVLRTHRLEFVQRTLTVYFVTLAVAGMILIAIDHLPLMTEPIIALKRMIIVAFPASFSATIVDSMSKHG